MQPRKLFLKEERKYLFSKEPHAKIFKRHEEKKHLFDRAVKDLRDEVSLEFSVNNSVRLLSSAKYQHPFVHKGYYDSKRRGVFYVKDALNEDKLIRKDEATLTTEGVFVKESNVRYIEDEIQSSTRGVQIFLDILNRNDSFWYTNTTLFKRTSHGLPHLIDLHTSRRLLCLILENPYEFVTLFLKYAHRYTSGQRDATATFINDRSIRNEVFSHYLLSPRGNGVSAEFFWEKQSTHNVFLFCYNSRKLYYREKKNNPKEVFVDYNEYFSTKGASGIIDCDLKDYPKLFQKQPLRLCNWVLLWEREEFEVGKFRKTRNRDGVELRYNAKVTDFRQCFMLTEKEKEIFIKNLRNPSGKLNPYRRPVFLGLELEYSVKAQTKEARARLINRIATSPFGKHCIIVFDRCTGEFGFEIVTVPATLNYHRDILKKCFFDKVNSFHKDLFCPPSCGLHVHIDQRVFTPLSLGLFVAFINKRSNRDFINAVANRSPTEFCRKWVLPESVPKKGKLVDCSAKAALRPERYHLGDDYHSRRRVAVNLENKETVEVRIFKASNNYNNVVRKLEFCDALVRFTRNISLREATVPAFIDFLLRKENHISAYPNLLTWLGSQGFVAHERRKVKGQDRLIHVYSKNLTKP